MHVERQDFLSVPVLELAIRPESPGQDYQDEVDQHAQGARQDSLV